MRIRSHPRRAAAVLAVVIVCIAAASLAVVLVLQTTFASRASMFDQATRGGRTVAAALVDAAVTQVGDDITLPFDVVLTGEQTRTCRAGPTSGTTYAAGAAWPATCGVAWSYAAVPLTPSGTLRVLHRPGGGLQLAAAARNGAVTAGVVRDVLPVAGGRYSLWSSGDLDLDAFDSTAATGGTVARSLTADGLLYAADRILLPTSSGITLTGAVLAGEGGFVGTANGTDVQYASATPNATVSPPIGDVRDIVEFTNSTLTAASSVAATWDVGCPNDPTSGTAGLPGRPADLTDAASHLCLRPGGEVLRVDGTFATIPTTTRSVLLDTSSTSGALSVYVSNAVASDCSVCNPYTFANPTVTSVPASHPSQSTGQFWTPLGAVTDVRLPRSGVVGATGVTVVAGACDRQFTTGATCDVLRATSGATTRPFTIVAGTADSPADIVIGAPTDAVTLVASRDVIVTSWAAPSGADVTLGGPVVATGSFRALPVDRLGANAGTLRTPAGVIAGTYANLTGYTGGLNTAGAGTVGPWAPGPRAGTVVTPAVPLRLSAMCADITSCGSWKQTSA